MVKAVDLRDRGPRFESRRGQNLQSTVTEQLRGTGALGGKPSVPGMNKWTQLSWKRGRVPRGDTRRTWASTAFPVSATSVALGAHVSSGAALGSYFLASCTAARRLFAAALGQCGRPRRCLRRRLSERSTPCTRSTAEQLRLLASFRWLFGSFRFRRSVWQKFLKYCPILILKF